MRERSGIGEREKREEERRERRARDRDKDKDKDRDRAVKANLYRPYSLHRSISVRKRTSPLFISAPSKVITSVSNC